jgi:Flp pilus assembly pilin Flp
VNATTVASGVDVGGSLSNALTNVFSFVPKLLIAIVIFVIFYFIAKALEKIITKVLQKVGFDDLVERGGVKTALEKSQYDAASILAKLVFYVVVLFGLSEAFGVFGANNPISSYLKAIIAFLPKAFVAIVILVIAAAIAAGVKTFVDSALGGLSYGSALATTASAIVIFFGLVAALNQIGVATAITTPIEYAVLAMLTGVVIVGVGGGLIVPMRQRWENALQKVADEAPTVRDNLAAQKEQVKAQAQQKAQEQLDRPSPGATRS